MKRFRVSQMSTRYDVEFIVATPPDATMSVAEDIIKVLESSMALDEFFVSTVPEDSGDNPSLDLHYKGTLFFEDDNSNDERKTIESEVFNIIQRIYARLPHCRKVLVNIANFDERFVLYELNEPDYELIRSGSDLKDEEHTRRANCYNVTLSIPIPKDFPLKTIAVIDNLIKSEFDGLSASLYKPMILPYHGIVKYNTPITPSELVSQLSRRIWNKVDLFIPLHWSVVPLDLYESKVFVYIVKEGQ